MAKQNIEIQQYVGGTTGYNNCYPNTGDANVKLSDSNATVWRDTLKDALPKISAMKDNQWEIGDIRISTKDSLGDKWLKTDGSVFNTSKYPNLTKVTVNKGFPFGNNTISELSFQGKQDSFYTANGRWDSWGEQIAAGPINGYYIRAEDGEYSASSKSFSFTFYYTKDFETWSSNSIKITLPFTSIGTKINLKFGKVNNFYYFSFINMQSKYLGDAFFIYSQAINSSSWNIVNLGSVKNWDGQLFYYNNKYITYPFIYDSSLSAQVVRKISSSSIDFSNNSGISVCEIGTRVADITGTNQSFFSYNIGSTIYVFWREVSNNSDATNRSICMYCSSLSDETLKSFFTVCSSSFYMARILLINDGKIALYYGKGATTTGTYYVAVLDGTVLTSTPSSSECATLPDFYTLNNKFCQFYRYEQGTTATIKLSISSNMLNYTTESNKFASGEDTLNSLAAVLEMETGCFFVENRWYKNSYQLDKQKVAKVSYGNILPNYSPESQNDTKLNAFIKALD